MLLGCHGEKKHGQLKNYVKSPHMMINCKMNSKEMINHIYHNERERLEGSSEDTICATHILCSVYGTTLAISASICACIACTIVQLAWGSVLTVTDFDVV